MKTMKKILAVLTFVICVMFCCISLGKQGVLAAGNYKDASRGHVYCFTTGTTYKMLNWVKEDGFSYAAIQGNPNYGYNFSASGYWSTDSI